MPKFKVEILTKALVSQVQHVEAKTKDEAERIALENMSDHPWEYEGVDEYDEPDVTVTQEGES